MPGELIEVNFIIFNRNGIDRVHWVCLNTTLADPCGDGELWTRGPSLGPTDFILMQGGALELQFSAKNNRFDVPPLCSWCPLPGKPWIRHCLTLPSKK